ncbi:ROK family transcriptional regulator [Asticcacaulis sp. AC460]|uniref:ROK family transcriptional regulator n=1 Tax=Asticcacaulis sp. AC460 TaxID=1282360 RepID=UPI0003C3B571|nr:ROK family transcriptional regulator [Asticcacaulis sp. AC460]ESQ91327.1 ROK family transcriptional regulator [Asticcacaulis sp. AC460]
MALTADRKPGISLAGTNMVRAGDYNQRVILQAIRAGGPVTRSELAGATGLTHQSVINITRRLMEDGIVQDEGAIIGGRGQPAARLAVNPDGAYGLGLNIDREHVTLMLMDLSGKVRHRAYIPQRFAMPEDVLGFVEDQLDNVLGRRLISRKRLVGLGIAMPERLDCVEASARPAAYSQWSSLDIVETFTERLHMPVSVRNDVTAAVLGELQFGQGFQFKSFVYTLISAGIGTGLVVNGQPYEGGLRQAGEIGKYPITQDGETGTLWDVLSVFAFQEMLGRRGIAPDRELDPSDAQVSAAVDAWVERAAGYMVAPYLALTYTLSPERHFIGGQLPPFVIERLCQALNARFASHSASFPMGPFCAATTAVDAAALGAAVLAFQERLLPSPDVLMK